MSATPPPRKAAQPEIDPLLRQRLNQLPPPPPRQTARAATPQGSRPGAANPGSSRTGAPKPGAPKKAKHAKGSKAASLAIAGVTTIGLAATFAHSDQAAGSGLDTPLSTVAGSTTATTGAAPATTAGAGTTGTTGATQATAAPTTAAATTAAASGGIADGTYVGNASQNRFGVVQVQVVYSGGKLVDVQILQYPDGDGRSYSISQRSLPTLIARTIKAQSAKINGVSGATYTSHSYGKSLQSALDAAKAAS